MKLPRFMRFIISYVIVGVIAAVSTVIFFPDLIKTDSQNISENALPSFSGKDNNPVSTISSNNQNNNSASAVTESTVSGKDTSAKPDSNVLSNDKVVFSYADAVERAAPAVVSIHTAKIVKTKTQRLFRDPVLQKFFGRRLKPKIQKRVETSLGSGVIVDSNGYILTSNHVIAGADKIQAVLHDGRVVEADIVGVDEETDLAVLKVSISDVPSIEFGEADQLRVGDVVLAIGDPFGIGQTVTQGIVSATGRSKLGIATFENFIQTDAAINPGNSGGALINARGQLVGINTAIYSKSGGSNGVGFSIPVDIATKVKDNIIENGYVVRGWLGVVPREINALMAGALGLKSDEGVFVEFILKNGPAYNAGIRQEDIILKIDDIAINDPQTAIDYLANIKPGDKVQITGLRKGKVFTTTAIAVQRPTAILGQEQ